MTDSTCPHCGTAIGEHEANACLDKWVAETVMGWKWMPTPDPEGQHYCWVKDGCEIGDFEPSSSISAAWEVVHHVRDTMEALVCIEVRHGSENVVWIYTAKGEYGGIDNNEALAICRAAVLAASEKEKT